MRRALGVTERMQPCAFSRTAEHTLGAAAESSRTGLDYVAHTRLELVMRPLIMIMRLLAVVQLVLGIGFWTGHFVGLVNLHMALGGIYVVALWVLCVLGRRAGALAATGFVWGLVVLGVGMAQRGLLIGDMHWVVRVLHLVISLAAMPIAEKLAASPVTSSAAS